MDLIETIKRMSEPQKKALNNLASSAKAAGLKLTHRNMRDLVEDVMESFDDFSAWARLGA